MRLRTRDILLLAVGWVFVVVALGTLFVALRSRSFRADSAPRPAPTYTVVFTQVTARSLYPAAEALAQAWQPDAQLVSLTATWGQTAVDQVGEPGEWVFRFYSPSWQHYYFVTVNPDGESWGVEHARQVDLPPPLIPVEAWRVDSVEALATWLDSGGGDMLGSKSGVEVSAQLNVPAEGGDLAWAVVGYDTLYNDYLTVMIHADTGAVLQTVKP